ncbi:hypothetical protein CC85DRAFT_283169 [Cutaneotrichosporon oleaginosum]|uniref:Uncharacterized protein n=1 Tax=Cutaneotrichosporon oleaginosum TaxID=879819 RepID=A0A0J0XUY3_9TREE|nr:uncharacterized protein CC85DRAFT_283169 [Cutaneotrichosporon oleaginosum]KLT44867.1 hypothetical protein CC85DRAFT_283169 [Cutaneotrichosporon oleaginosum]TXT12000.1 hypothetical protein COLE_02410 [Cutaneotrichosporon oleaginosum]
MEGLLPRTWLACWPARLQGCSSAGSELNSPTVCSLMFLVHVLAAENHGRIRANRSISDDASQSKCSMPTIRLSLTTG